MSSFCAQRPDLPYYYYLGDIKLGPDALERRPYQLMRRLPGSQTSEFVLSAISDRIASIPFVVWGDVTLGVFKDCPTCTGGTTIALVDVSSTETLEDAFPVRDPSTMGVGPEGPSLTGLGLCATVTVPTGSALWCRMPQNPWTLTRVVPHVFDFCPTGNDVIAITGLSQALLLRQSPEEPATLTSPVPLVSQFGTLEFRSSGGGGRLLAFVPVAWHDHGTVVRWEVPDWGGGDPVADDVVVNVFPSVFPKRVAFGVDESANELIAVRRSQKDPAAQRLVATPLGGGHERVLATGVSKFGFEQTPSEDDVLWFVRRDFPPCHNSLLAMRIGKDSEPWLVSSSVGEFNLLVHRDREWLYYIAGENSCLDPQWIWRANLATKESQVVLRGSQYEEVEIGGVFGDVGGRRVMFTTAAEDRPARLFDIDASGLSLPSLRFEDGPSHYFFALACERCVEYFQFSTGVALHRYCF